MKSAKPLQQIGIMLPFLLIISYYIPLNAQEGTGSGETKFFTGPFQKLFETGADLFIYPTGFEDSTEQEFLHEITRGMASYGQNAEILSDTSALDRDVSGVNVFTSGNMENNAWLRANANHLLFQITDQSLVTDRVYDGDNLMLTLCQPNPLNPEKGWFLMCGQQKGSYDHLMGGGQGWLQKDWSILDPEGTLASDNFIKQDGKWVYKKIEYIDISDQARWIWYPGDFAIELNRRTAILRRERNEIYPPLWRLDAPYGRVSFHKRIRVTQPDTIAIYADGELSVLLDGDRLYDFDPERLPLSPRSHYLLFEVVNFDGLPALLVKGKSVVSDTSWRVAFGWIDKGHVPGSWHLNDPGFPPSNFRLKEKEIRPASLIHNDTSLFADFGQETFGRLILKGIQGEGDVLVVYGESLEEASAGKIAETWEIRTISKSRPENDTLPVPMGFRYVNLIPSGDVVIEDLSHLYEYLPMETRGTFECSDPVLNRIYEVSARTLELNTREVMTDGIKRDRWAWAGDILIGLHCNYYHFFEEDVIRRSQVALRGHDPVIGHINTIPGFSFYWFINMYNHYFYTGDTLFIRNNYEKMKSLMDFCLDRRNDDGFFSIDFETDWPWVDWTEYPIREVMSFEQIQMLRSLQIMAGFSELLHKQDDAGHYQSLASELKEKIWEHFWKDDLPGFVHHEVDSGDAPVTGYSNIYAIELGLLEEEQVHGIVENILLNDTYPDVYIPFHKAFKASALCRAGKHELAVQGMRDFWKGMLDMGATTFWEHYNPELEGVQHYEHSGREFCKSLCHAWSAGPLYIAGRHIAGVVPLSPGYKSYLVEPNLCGLEWFRASIPVKGGMVNISMDEKEINVMSSIAGGKCRFRSARKPKLSCGMPEKIGDQLYEVTLEKDREYKIRYY